MSGISSPTTLGKVQQVQTTTTQKTSDKQSVKSEPTIKSGGDSLGSPVVQSGLGDKSPKSVTVTKSETPTKSETSSSPKVKSEAKQEPPKPPTTKKHDVGTEKQKTNNTCWACSARMLLKHDGQQAPSYQTLDPNDLGMDPTDQGVKQKLNGLGIQDVNYNSSDDLTPERMAQFLENGPMMASGRFTGYDAHVIVVTGVDGGTVHYNDPDNGGKKTMTLDTFKDLLNPIDTLRAIMPDSMSPLQQIQH
ncbi:papain-like cysteine protease family protein [Acanthopleuribacter pedis]|uniref:Peptidase C39-like domain-containing protein n=1 Tax=Acanthopleuribacter pedis TaxID=442870 RepID=A0A8J7U801_9BACT|nr:papain-like cysteine protease family protein [Acanthopleuribacter pedis]MBO1321951.1 hypothetical protein [Acanthopleuribacter pedis]